MEKIADVLKDAKRAIDENGFLDLPDRKRIWRCFGDVPTVIQQPNVSITEGLKRRFALAELCFKRIIALFKAGAVEYEADGYDEEDFDDFNEVDRILKLANRYLNGETGVDELLEVEERLSVAFSDGAEIPGLTMEILSVALRDEKLLYCSDESTKDRDLDFDGWDLAYFARIYARAVGSDENIAEKEYWTWYVDEAIPTVLNAGECGGVL